MDYNGKKALIAMSGGVDSSVSALLMKDAGAQCVGVTMRLFDNDDVDIDSRSCCSLDDAADAARVAGGLGMQHYVFDFAEDFRKEVMERFVSEYEDGATPNPCIDCNKYIKYQRLFERMQLMDFDLMVTGHYARIERDDEAGRYLLKKALDETKDQSYVLYMLTQEQLAHTVFPLGGLRKTQVREIAAEHKFGNAKKKDSQDICFVRGQSYAQFIENFSGKTFPPGNFTDTEGRVIGRHEGIIKYTIGQRKGLGKAFGEPMYVVQLKPETNEVVLGRHEDLFKTTLTAGNVNLISVESIIKPLRTEAKIRYAANPAPATVYPEAEGRIRVEFDEPQRAITKGQSVVLYEGDTVIGGGIIE